MRKIKVPNFERGPEVVVPFSGIMPVLSVVDAYRPTKFSDIYFAIFREGLTRITNDLPIFMVSTSELANWNWSLHNPQEQIQYPCPDYLAIHGGFYLAALLIEKNRTFRGIRDTIEVRFNPIKATDANRTLLENFLNEDILAQAAHNLATTRTNGVDGMKTLATRWQTEDPTLTTKPSFI